MKFCTKNSRKNKNLKYFNVVISWVVTPYSDMVGYQRFGGLCCLNLQGEVLSSVFNLLATILEGLSIILSLQNITKTNERNL